MDSGLQTESVQEFTPRPAGNLLSGAIEFKLDEILAAPAKSDTDFVDLGMTCVDPNGELSQIESTEESVSGHGERGVMRSPSPKLDTFNGDSQLVGQQPGIQDVSQEIIYVANSSSESEPDTPPSGRASPVTQQEGDNSNEIWVKPKFPKLPDIKNVKANTGTQTDGKFCGRNPLSKCKRFKTTYRETARKSTSAKGVYTCRTIPVIDLTEEDD